MDELEALKLIRGEKTVEVIDEPKENKRLSPKALLAIIILLYIGMHLILFISATHPLDRFLFKMVLTRNYTITMSLRGDTSTVVVDGDAIYNGKNYFTKIDGQTYIYYVDSSGRWQMAPYNQGVIGGVSDGLIITLLNKDNYKPKLIKIGSYKMNDNLSPGGMKNVTSKLMFGQFYASGDVSVTTWNGTGIYELNIRISRFGKSKLELPTVGEYAK